MDKEVKLLDLIGHNSPGKLQEDLRQIRDVRFRNDIEGYCHYLDQTYNLFDKLKSIDEHYVVSSKGKLKIHLYPPATELELGEYYFQAGISQPGTLAIKFAKLSQTTERREISQATLEEKHYSECIGVHFFKEFRERASFAGDSLFRLCLVRDTIGDVRKVETKQIFGGKTRRKVQKATSVPLKSEEWPETINQMDSALLNCLVDGLSRKTYLPGKDHLSFARKLGYEEDEVLIFDKSENPARAIITDMTQTHPMTKVSCIVGILQQMGRQDIILACQKQLKGRRKLDKSRSLDVVQHERLRAASDPQHYQDQRRQPVESSDRLSGANPAYPSLDQAVVTTSSAINAANPSYPTLAAAVCTSQTHCTTTLTTQRAGFQDSSSPTPLNNDTKSKNTNVTVEYLRNFTSTVPQAGDGACPNSSYPPLQKSVGDLISRPEGAQNCENINSAPNGAHMYENVSYPPINREFRNRSPPTQDKGHVTNPGYPPITRRDEGSTDSVNEVKRHMQPEGDLDLPDLD